MYVLCSCFCRINTSSLKACTNNNFVWTSDMLRSLRRFPVYNRNMFLVRVFFSFSSSSSVYRSSLLFSFSYVRLTFFAFIYHVNSVCTFIWKYWIIRFEVDTFKSSALNAFIKKSSTDLISILPAEKKKEKYCKIYTKIKRIAVIVQTFSFLVSLSLNDRFIYPHSMSTTG